MKKFLLTFIGLLVISFPFASFGQDYVIGGGDVLKVTVYDHEDLTQIVRVSADGTIMLSLLGQEAVGGLSVTEITEKIADKYADGYLVNPQVNVFIEEFRSGKATILGQIANPGLYELRHLTSLLELISMAGGLTDDAGDIATIKRMNQDEDGAKNIITIDLKQLLEKGDTTLNFHIEPGDNVYIQKANLVYVNGEVTKPGVYKCVSDTSVIKAITLAGGFTDKAAPSRVKLIRKVDDREEIYKKVNMDILVQSNDIIVVPESFF